MKFIPLILFLSALSGCNFSKQEKQLAEREAIILQKEKSLDSQQIVYNNFLTEFNRLKALEDSLNRLYADSTMDSIPKNLLGTWDVLMECTKSDCTGYAVGDKKNETWLIEHLDSVLVTRALQGGKLLRLYAAKYADSTITLLYPNQLAVTDSPSASKMEVVLRPQSTGTLSGTRLLTLPNGCQVTFKVDLSRSSPSSK